MMKFFRKLKNKKGFTLVELITVIAIIGVLTAMIVPALAYDNKPSLAKAAAKDMYFVAQDSLASVKISNPSAITNNITFYADVDVSGNITESGLMTGGRKSFTNLLTTGVKSGAALTDTQKMYDKLNNDFEKYVTTLTDLKGTYYINVDTNYRVEAVYWTDAPTSTGLTNDTVYVDENSIDGYYCLAFPEDKCLAGQTFKYYDK